jgi:type VI secretion system secreted protein Hcp
MPPPPKGASTGSASDIFLHVQTARAGKIKGEANTKDHQNDIDVRSWNWGLAASSAIGSGMATGRRSYQNLVVTKGIDTASTALLSALATNDKVTEAMLAMRKAGGEALDYYRMTLRDARVVAVDVDVDAAGLPVERVSFSFQKIEIEYKPQEYSGIGSGSFVFTDEWLTEA